MNRKAESVVEKVITEPAQSKSEKLKLSLQQPVWHVIVLTALTFTTYIIYWLYKTARDLRHYSQFRLEKSQSALPELNKYERIPAPFWGIAAPVPFLNLAALAVVFRDIAQLSHEIGSNPADVAADATTGRHNPIFSALVLTISVFAIWVTGRVDNPLFLLFTLAGIPVSIAQHWLNRMWRAVEIAEHEEDRLVRHAFSPFEIIAILIGAMALALVVIGFTVVPAK
ncbi:MAG: hypothetical protein K2Z81_08510 [Cyanobacteria bacterium]|nr:hypothetical protein [Cyanobacteriota bacterium]